MGIGPVLGVWAELVFNIAKATWAILTASTRRKETSRRIHWLSSTLRHKVKSRIHNLPAAPVIQSAHGVPPNREYVPEHFEAVSQHADFRGRRVAPPNRNFNGSQSVMPRQV